MYFYPSDGSPGCTKQANAFKSSIKDFKSKGAAGGPICQAVAANRVSFIN